MEPVLDLVVGFIAGALSGLLGVGGGFVVVPYLLATQTTGSSVANAIAAGVLCVLPICTYSAVLHSRRTRENPLLNDIITQTRIYALAAAVVGSAIAMMVPERLTASLFALLVAFSAWATLSGGSGQLVERAIPFKRRFLPRVNAGVFMGLGGGLIGAGGGYLTVPYVQCVRRMPMHDAISVSAVMTIYIIGGACVTATVRAFASVQTIHWMQVATVATAGLIGVLVGTRYGQKISTLALKRLFAFYLVALSLRMAARAVL